MSYDKNTVELVTRLVIDSLNTIYNKELKVPAGISARHVHLEKKHLELLFGEGYELTRLKPLSQPGQFAANETVELVGPKGTISKVRILGPKRVRTQVEVAMTDARKLGLRPPVKASGNISGTPGITLRGPKGEVTITEGVIIAERHIHFSTEEAARYFVKNGQRVSLRVDGEKGGILNNVTVRVADDYSLDCHIDTDDASAFQIQQGQILTMLREQNG